MSKTIEKYNLYYKVLDENIFPQEWIVRIFMGKYPKLNIRDDLKNKKILEVSCGDGRNFPPLLKKKMKVYATEVSDVIVNNLKNTFPKIPKYCKNTSNLYSCRNRGTRIIHSKE